MQIAEAQGERSKPGGAKYVLLAQDRVEIVVMRCRAGGWKRGLLDERVVGDIGIHAGPQKPGGARRFRPVESQATQIVPKRDGNIVGNRDGRDAGNQPLRSEPSQRIELGQAGGTVGDAGVLANFLNGSEKPKLVLYDWATQRANV